MEPHIQRIEGAAKKDTWQMIDHLPGVLLELINEVHCKAYTKISRKNQRYNR